MAVAPRLLVIEDVADHCVQANFFDDSISNYTKVVDELVEVLLLITCKEDWMKGPVITTGHGLHHRDGDGGAPVSSVPGDLVNTVSDIL